MPRPRSKYDGLFKKYGFLSKLPMFECGDGWFEIVKELCAELEKLQLGPQFTIVQVEEKFGILRVYVEGAHPRDIPLKKFDALGRLMEKAARESAKTCEWCGQPGRRTTMSRGYYIITLCRKCKAKTNK